MRFLKSMIGVQLILIFASVLFYSCHMKPQKFTDETPTRGNIKIAVDES